MALALAPAVLSALLIVDRPPHISNPTNPQSHNTEAKAHLPELLPELQTAIASAGAAVIAVELPEKNYRAEGLVAQTGNSTEAEVAAAAMGKAAAEECVALRAKDGADAHPGRRGFQGAFVCGLIWEWIKSSDGSVPWRWLGLSHPPTHHPAHTQAPTTRASGGPRRRRSRRGRACSGPR